MFQSDSQNFLGQSIEDDLNGNLEFSKSQPETYQNRADDSSNAETLLQLGILYWRRGDFDRSERLITKAHEIAVNHPDIHFLTHCFIALALVKTSLEKDEDAIIAYKQAIKLSPENIRLWNNLASLYQKRGQIEQAFSAYENAIKFSPGNPVAWNGLANIHYQNGNIEEAIDAYKRTIALLPEINVENPNFNNRNSETNKLFVLPWLRLADLYIKKCQYLKAIELYKVALTLDVENAEIWNAMGTLYIKVEDYEEALEALSRAIELNPENGEVFLNLAIVYAKLDRPQDSIPLLIKSIEILPNKMDKERASSLMDQAIRDIKKNDVKNTHNIGTEIRAGSSNEDVTWFQYKYDEEFNAINFSFPAFEQKHTDANSPDKRRKQENCALINMKNAQQAKKGEFTMLGQIPASNVKEIQPKKNYRPDYTQDTKVEISDPVVWNENGNIYFNSRDYREAIISYKNAIEIDPSFGQPYHNLALIYYIQGNYDESILLYQKSIQLIINDHEKAIAWNGLGDVYRCKKDYGNACLAYQQASEIDKKNRGFYEKPIVFEVSEEQRTVKFWNDLGKLLFKTGAYGKAASAFQKSIQLEPSSGYAYSYLARALTAQGQYKEAITLYRKSIDLIPNENEKANAWNRLGDVHRKLNDYDSALKAYKNATTLTNEKLSLLDRTRLSLLSNRTAR